MSATTPAPGINTIKRHTQSKDFGVIRRLQLVDRTQMTTGTGTFKWSFRCTYYKPDGYDSISAKKKNDTLERKTCFWFTKIIYRNCKFRYDILKKTPTLN